MGKSFRGQFRVKLDQKGRISLPSSIRQVLSSGKKQLQLVFTNSIYNKNRFLDAYPLKEWESLEKKVSKWPQMKTEVQAYKRFYLAAGQIIDGDSQNRFLIPQGLRSFAAIESATEVVIVGMGDKLEIWPATVWDKLNQKMSDDFEDILAKLSDIESLD